MDAEYEKRITKLKIALKNELENVSNKSLIDEAIVVDSI